MSAFFSDRVSASDTQSRRGRGVFAYRYIAAGEVLELQNESWKLCPKEIITDLPRRLQVLCCEDEYDEQSVICPTDFENPPLSHLVNHSCDPNMASTDNYDTVVALRHIKAGDEITFDYATFNVGIDAFACACGAECCRRVITGKDWAHAELQEKYRGYFQKNIQAKIDALRRRG